MTRSTLKTFRNRLPTLAALVAFITFALLVAAAGCSSSTPTGVAPSAGHYELRAVDGRSLPDDRLGGAIAGELVLTRDGRATRTVQYATSGVPGPIVRRGDGTYRWRGREVRLLLVQEHVVFPENTVEIRGEVGRGTIVLRAPGPAGRVAEETYVRVERAG
jgi:hypothetical protein